MIARTVRGLPSPSRGIRVTLRRSAAVAACCVGAITAAIAVGPAVPRAPEIELLAAEALIMTGTDMYVVDQAWMDMATHNYIQPTLGGDYTGIPVTTPAQFWPFTGPEDMLFDLSVLDGTQVIGAAIEAQHNPTVVFGYSQSAVIATAAKRRLAESAAIGSPVPEVSFVMLANLNRPNGGINARFAGAFIEELGWTFSAAAPTDTQFQTVDVARQYDLFADFPRYPLNVIATANAVVALLYGAHDYSAVTLNPADAGYDPNTVVQQWGDTTYYFIPSTMLPLLRPLRDLGGDALLLDAAEPALRVLVEFGYDRTTPFGQPMPAQLIPRNDVEQLGRDLAAAIEQGRAILDGPNPPATETNTTTPPARGAERTDVSTVAASAVAGRTLRTRAAIATPPSRAEVSPAPTPPLAAETVRTRTTASASRSSR